MKRISLLFATLIVIMMVIESCNKNASPQPQTNQTLDVSFNVNSVLQGGGAKSALSDTIKCTDGVKATYVMYKMDNGAMTTIPVFYVGNIPWTNTIKLTAGVHSLQEFIVYSDNNTPNNTADDVVLMAAPHAGSVFAGYVTTPLNQNFTVAVDQKNAVKIDVVCFQPSYFLKYGFVYFHLNQLEIRQQWFFGDFCIKDKSEYAGSHYALQPGWTGTGYGDVPAIFKVEVWREGVLQNTFSNDDATDHYGDKVSVTYGDYAEQTDHFTFKLYILVRQGTSFNFVLFNNWTFADISTITPGSDNVVDFILGSCYDPLHPPQLILPPYMNLPAHATFTITGAYAPGSLGAYVDATLANILPNGSYNLNNGVYPSNCADHQTNITVGTPYNMDVYSSLYPNLLPLFVQDQVGKWAKINWIFNHRDWYPNLTWYELQQAVWLFDNVAWDGTADGGVPALNNPAYLTRASQIKADADQYGVNFVPPPGGYAAIVFVPTGTSPNAPTAAIQTMFIQIDP